MYLGPGRRGGAGRQRCSTTPRTRTRGAAREHARPGRRVPRRAAAPRGRDAVDLGAADRLPVPPAVPAPREARPARRRARRSIRACSSAPDHAAACHFAGGGDAVPEGRRDQGSEDGARNPATAAELGLMQGSPPDRPARDARRTGRRGRINRWSFQHASERRARPPSSRAATARSCRWASSEDLDGIVLEEVECASTLGAFLEQHLHGRLPRPRDGRIVLRAVLQRHAAATRGICCSRCRSRSAASSPEDSSSRGAVELEADGRDLRAGAVGLDLRRRDRRRSCST